MCRQPATGGGVSPWAKSVCAYECVLTLRRGGGGEKRGERVYVGMQVRIRGRSERQEGKRSQVLLLILPLIRSPQTHTHKHWRNCTHSLYWSSELIHVCVCVCVCVFSALGATEGISQDTRMRQRCGGAKEEEPECASPRGELTRTADSTHTPAGHSALFPWQLEWAAICAPCRNGRNTTNCCMRLHR